MANKRYDIMSPRKGKDKTFWTRIGTAWEGDKGIQLVFDALPLPDAEGRCVANLFEPRDNSGGGQQQGRSQPSQGYPSYGDDADSVPY